MPAEEPGIMKKGWGAGGSAPGGDPSGSDRREAVFHLMGEAANETVQRGF